MKKNEFYGSKTLKDAIDEEFQIILTGRMDRVTLHLWAFQIMKDKDFDVGFFKYCVKSESFLKVDALKHYNKLNKHITEKEFEILKRALL